MNISVLIFLVLLPFLFSVPLAFFLIQKGLSLYTISLTSLFSFFAILASSILQLLISFCFSQFLKEEKLTTVLFTSFVYSGAIEEIIKFFFFHCTLAFFIPTYVEMATPITHHPSQKLRKQLFILAMFFASCFAGFENISYIVLNIKLLPIRLITANLFHIFIASYYIDTKCTKKSYFSFLIVPILLHGSYNMLIMTESILSIFAFIIILFLLLRTYQGYLS